MKRNWKHFSSVVGSWSGPQSWRILLLLVWIFCPSGSALSSSRSGLSDCPALAASRRSGCKSTLCQIYFVAFELGPSSALEDLVELGEVIVVEEIDEAVADIALVSDVAGQVQEIVGVGKKVVNFLWKFFDGVFIGDVPDHDGSAGVHHDFVLPDCKYATLLTEFITESPGRVVGVVVGVFEVVLHLGADVHGAGWTFLNGVCHRKNTPKFASLVLYVLVGCLLALAPNAPDALALDLWEDRVEGPLDDLLAFGLPHSDGTFFCLLDFLLLGGVTLLRCLWLSETGWAFGDSPLVALLIADKAGNTIAGDVEFDFEGTLVELGRVALWLVLVMPFPLPLTFHVENF